MADDTEVPGPLEPATQLVAVQGDGRDVLPSAVAASPADIDWLNRRSSWELVARLLGAAAGSGAIVLVMGAAVVWVRLLAAGLPPEEGLSVTSTQALIVAGVHVLVLPVAITLAGFAAGPYISKVDAHWDDEPTDAAARGTPPARIRVRNWAAEHWFDVGKAADSKAGGSEDASRGLLGKLVSWAEDSTPKSWAVLVLGLPLWVVLVPYLLLIGFLQRHRLMFLWWIVVLPFTWTWVSLASIRQ